MGLRPGKVHATAAAAAEAGGGALLVAGAATPLAAAALTGTMTVAIDTVHAAKGPWNQKGGYEYNATLIAAVFAITARRAGRALAGPARVGHGVGDRAARGGRGGAAAMLRWAHAVAAEQRSEPERERRTRTRAPARVRDRSMPRQIRPGYRIDRSESSRACAAFARVTKFGPVATTSPCAGRIP